MTTTPENTGPTPRPNSKRSDPDWLTRTYFLEKTTDIEVEAELIKLRRDGIEMDKSDLVNSVLKGWVAGRRGQVPESDTTKTPEASRSPATEGAEPVTLEEVLRQELNKLRETADIHYQLWRKLAPNITDLLASTFEMFADWDPRNGDSLATIINMKAARVQTWSLATSYAVDYQALTEVLENPPGQDHPLLVFEISRQWFNYYLEAWFEEHLILERTAAVRKSLNLIKDLPQWVDPGELFGIVAELDQALRIVDQQFPYNVNPEPPF